MDTFDDSTIDPGGGVNIDAMLEEQTAADYAMLEEQTAADYAMLEELSKELNIDAMLEELAGAVKKLPHHRQGQLFDELEGRA
jgi:hypothetical protein